VLIEENGALVVSIPGEPYYDTQNHMDLFVNGLGDNDTVGGRALQALEEHKGERFLLFIHFQEPDHLGHANGENSQEYTDGIKQDDEWTGKLIGKLRELGVYGETLIYIVVDHGFNEGGTGHSYAPYVFVATNDPAVNRDGDRADIAPTVLKRFGIEPTAQTPPVDGTPLDEPAERRIAPAEKPPAPWPLMGDAAKPRRANRGRGTQQ